MTLEEQIEFEKQQLQDKIAKINDARALVELLKVGAGGIGTKAVEAANGSASFDEKLENMFNALQEIVDMIANKQDKIEKELSDYESQLKLIDLLQASQQQEGEDSADEVDPSDIESEDN